MNDEIVVSIYFGVQFIILPLISSYLENTFKHNNDNSFKNIQSFENKVTNWS